MEMHLDNRLGIVVVTQEILNNNNAKWRIQKELSPLLEI